MLSQLPRGQSWISQKHRELGYSFKGFWCYGVASLSVEALLLRNIDQFEKRLQLLHSMSVEEILEKKQAVIEKLNYKVFRFRDQWRQEIRLNLAGYGLSEHDIELNLNQRIYQACLSVITDQEELILNLIPSIDSVTLYQNARQTYRFFPYKQRSSHQDIEKKSPFVSSLAIEKHGGLSFMNHFTGVYNKLELQYLFLSLEYIARQHPVPEYPIALFISRRGHRIQVGYDPKNACWYFIDANRLRKIHSIKNDIAKLVDAVFLSFKNAVYCPITTLCITLKERDFEWRNRLQAWQKQIEFMHAATLAKIQYVSRQSNTWLHLAAYEGDLASINKILAQKGSESVINVPNNRGATPLYYAVIKNHNAIAIQLIKHGADSQVIVNNRSIIDVAIKHKRYSVIDAICIAKLTNYIKIKKSIHSRAKVVAEKIAAAKALINVIGHVTEVGSLDNFLSHLQSGHLGVIVEAICEIYKRCDRHLLLRQVIDDDRRCCVNQILAYSLS